MHCQHTHRNDRELYGYDGLSPTWPYNNSIQSPSFAKNLETEYNNEQMDGFVPNLWVHQTPQELSSNPQSANYTSTNKFFSPPPQQLSENYEVSTQYNIRINEKLTYRPEEVQSKFIPGRHQLPAPERRRCL